MKRHILISGTTVNENWQEANASANQDALNALGKNNLVAVVTGQKLKIFGYDTQDVLRSRSWVLPKDYSLVSDPETFEGLKLTEAGEIIKRHFKNITIEMD